MNGNLLRHLTLFSLAVALLITCGCSRSPTGEIESVLNRCAEISKKANALQGDPAAQAGYVADGFQAIDTSGCPQDFRVAFQDHVSAWLNAQSAFGKSTITAAVAVEIMARSTENYFGVGADASEAMAAFQEIDETYSRLTLIAVQYGARIPTQDNPTLGEWPSKRRPQLGALYYANI